MSSWKGSEERSGGIIANIGVHFLDLLVWLYGPMRRLETHLREPRKAAGFLELEQADVRWFLSIDPADLPPAAADTRTFRSIQIDGIELDLSRGLDDLHTRLYQETLEGRGCGIAEARPSIELMYRIRKSEISAPGSAGAHPMVHPL